MNAKLRHWLWNLSIRRKLTAAIVGTSAVVVLVLAVFVSGYKFYDDRRAMLTDLSTLADVVAATSTAAISFGDPHTAREILQALNLRPAILVACVYSKISAHPGVFAAYERDQRHHACPDQPQEVGASYRFGQFSAVSNISLDGDAIGRLYLAQSDREIWLALRVYLLVLGGVLLLSIGIAAGLSRVMQHFVARPILSLAQTAERISQTENYAIRAPEFGQDEVGHLIRSFNGMLAQIAAAEQNLHRLNGDLQAEIAERSRANEELRETLQQLRNTQEQLIQTEKMASLGALVAGVAHEINTPIGIGVTAASTLQGKVEELRHDFENQTLTSSGLRRFLELTEQSTGMILGNLERSAVLIQSFKQVAVDQSNPDHRRFEVAAYLEEVLSSLRPRLRKTGVEVQVDCPPALEIDSYPGAISQIVTNLVINSLVHGYADNSAGQVSIQVRPNGKGMEITYRDDGRGIAAENLPHIFDPFFTTARGAGGSGLGLHIVYNLVTQQLGGRIVAHSAPGAGAEFVFTVADMDLIDEQHR